MLDNGNLREFDQPFILLQDKSSLLSKLVEQTGKGVASQLLEVAQAHYKEQQEEEEGEDIQKVKGKMVENLDDR